MNVNSVRVKGLFDHFDHDLAFGSDERIMIVIGPNGIGKTTTLMLIDVLFNQSVRRLASMPFGEIEISFDEGANLIATRETETDRHDGHRMPLTLSLQRGGKSQTYRFPMAPVDPKDLRIPASAIEDIIPELDRVQRRVWRNRYTGALLDLDDVLTVYRDEFPSDILRGALASPEWLQDVQNSVEVLFIDTERLTSKLRSGRRGRKGRSQRTVRRYSEELAERITKSITKYGALSQSLDRTFPARLVADGRHTTRSVETLRADLDAIEQKRSRLEEVGLLAGDQHGIDIPDLGHVDESQRGVLAVYAQDAKYKLAVFDALYDKVSTFRRIANARFRHKQVAVSAEGLSVVTGDGDTLDLEKLSSGEQHELVMLYELLFCASGSSLILIDEPELSLHVAWQEQWVKDLEETATLSDFRAIVATHSPEIIGDRWSLTVELNGAPSD